MRDRLFWHRTADLRAKLALGKEIGEGIENLMLCCSCPLALRGGPDLPRSSGYTVLQRLNLLSHAGARKRGHSKIMSLEEFFAMGGYAFYVWTAYGVALAVLVFNLILPLRRKAEVLKSIERLFKLERPRP